MSKADTLQSIPSRTMWDESMLNVDEPHCISFSHIFKCCLMLTSAQNWIGIQKTLRTATTLQLKARLHLSGLYLNDTSLTSHEPHWCVGIPKLALWFVVRLVYLCHALAADHWPSLPCTGYVSLPIIVRFSRSSGFGNFRSTRLGSLKIPILARTT